MIGLKNGPPHSFSTRKDIVNIIINRSQCLNMKMHDWPHHAILIKDPPLIKRKLCSSTRMVCLQTCRINRRKFIRFGSIYSQSEGPHVSFKSNQACMFNNYFCSCITSFSLPTFPQPNGKAISTLRRYCPVYRHETIITKEKAVY